MVINLVIWNLLPNVGEKSFSAAGSIPLHRLYPFVWIIQSADVDDCNWATQKKILFAWLPFFFYWSCKRAISCVYVRFDRCVMPLLIYSKVSKLHKWHILCRRLKAIHWEHKSINGKSMSMHCSNSVCLCECVWTSVQSMHGYARTLHTTHITYI